MFNDSRLNNDWHRSRAFLQNPGTWDVSAFSKINQDKVTRFKPWYFRTSWLTVTLALLCCPFSPKCFWSQKTHKALTGCSTHNINSLKCWCSYYKIYSSRQETYFTTDYLLFCLQIASNDKLITYFTTYRFEIFISNSSLNSISVVYTVLEFSPIYYFQHHLSMGNVVIPEFLFHDRFTTTHCTNPVSSLI